MSQADTRKKLRTLERAEPLPGECPPPLVGYVFSFKFNDGEGDCWCVYHKIGDPMDWYQRPCNP